MTWEQIQHTIIAVCTSTVGSGLIAFLAYIIKDAIVRKVDSKKSKLLDTDKKEIAIAVKEGIRDGVEVDITNELDKATKKLISEQKDKINELIKQHNEDHKLLVGVAQLLTQFKSIQGKTALDELQKALDEVDKGYVDTVDNGKVLAKVKVADEEVKVEEKKLDLKY